MRSMAFFRGFIFLLLISSSICYDCIHDLLTVNKTQLAQSYLQFGHRNVRERDTGRLPIRITLDTSRLDTVAQTDSNYTCYETGQVIQAQDGSIFTCGSGDVLTLDKSNFVVNNLLADSIARIQKTLSVDRVQGNLKVDSGLYSCYSSSITPTFPPQEYIDVGVNDTDLLVFVTARHITTPRVLAFASECQTDQYFRATVGFINFDPANLETQIEADYPTKFGATIHEMSHVLGYSSAKFEQFVDSDGNSIPPSDVTLTEIDSDGLAIVKLHSPNVLAFVRDYFNCSTLTGAAVENQGTNGTAYSHWEKRIFGNEYLVGTTTDNPQFSNVTLSYFSDCGWYDVDFTQADDLRWGYQLGCDWVNLRCNTWTAENYLCKAETTTTTPVSCNFDRSAKVPCNLIEDYPSGYIAEAFQYFDNPSWGGSDVYADFCPYYESSQTDGVTIYCSDDQNQDSVSYIDTGENYCSTCKCFSSNLVAYASSSDENLPLRCYNITCIGPTSLKVQLADLWYDCPTGGSIDSPGVYEGTLVCPNTNVLCKNAVVDTTWPSFTSVSPSSGAPGDTLMITGTNFQPDMIVAVAGIACVSAIYMSATSYKCVVADSEYYSDLSNLLGSYSDISMKFNNEDKSTVGQRSFYLKTGASGVLGQFGAWINANPFIATILLILLIVGISVCCYCCFREFKRAQGLGEKRLKKEKGEDIEL